MITVLIFDDQAEIARIQRGNVERAMPAGVDFEVTLAQSRDELTQLLAEGIKVDILLADIRMPAGEPTGIEVVRELFPAGSGTQVIFVSGYLEEALEVYAADHLYFLLKPLDLDKLSEALTRACANLERSRPVMMRFREGRRERALNAAQITYLESRLHKVFVHTRTATYESYAKLDDLARQLPRGFTRCHRSFLVNLSQIQSLEGQEIRLHDGTAIPVSRRRARETQRDLLAFLSGQGAGEAEGDTHAGEAEGDARTGEAAAGTPEPAAPAPAAHLRSVEELAQRIGDAR